MYPAKKCNRCNYVLRGCESFGSHNLYCSKRMQKRTKKCSCCGVEMLLRDFVNKHVHCLQCSKCFTRKEYEDHIHCTFCDLLFTKSEYEIHKKSVCSEKKLKCPRCELSPKKKDSLDMSVSNSVMFVVLMLIKRFQRVSSLEIRFVSF